MGAGASGLRLLYQNRKRERALQIPFDENPDLLAVLDQHAAWYARKIGEVRPEYCVFPGRGRPTKSEARPLNPSRSIGDVTTAWENLREKTGIEC